MPVSRIRLARAAQSSRVGTVIEERSNSSLTLSVTGRKSWAVYFSKNAPE